MRTQFYHKVIADSLNRMRSLVYWKGPIMQEAVQQLLRASRDRGPRGIGQASAWRIVQAIEAHNG